MTLKMKVLKPVHLAVIESVGRLKDFCLSTSLRKGPALKLPNPWGGSAWINCPSASSSYRPTKARPNDGALAQMAWTPNPDASILPPAFTC